MKEVILRLLRDNPAIFYCRICRKILKAYVLGRAFEAGYQWVVGHAKEGASVALNRFFGAKLLRRHVNWSDTGDAYRFYELKLRSPARGSPRRRTHATLFRRGEKLKDFI